MKLYDITHTTVAKKAPFSACNTYMPHAHIHVPAQPQVSLWTGGPWVCCCMRCWQGSLHLTLEAMTCQTKILSTEDYLFQGTVKLNTCVGYNSLCLLSHDILCLLAHQHYSCILVLLCATVILEKTVRIPRSLSVKAAQVLKGFLNKVHDTRTSGICLMVDRLIGAYIAIIITSVISSFPLPTHQ